MLTSIWDKVKVAAVKAKCTVGFHSGSEKNVDGKPLCYYEKTCSDCAKVISSVRHNYPHEWHDAPYDYGSSVSCARVQNCIHCNSVAKREIHEEYREVGINGRCEEVYACARCGKEETRDVRHSFYRAGSTESGSVILKCTRCGTTETRSHY